MYPKKKFDGGSRFGAKRDFGRPQLYSATCVNCGNTCEVPFKPMGNRPVFCRDCFKSQGEGNGAAMGPKKWENRSESRGGFESRGADDRLMYPAECDTCHNECKVPFRPTQGRPVYCHRCMAAQNGGGEFGNAREERSFAPAKSFAPAAPAAGSKMSDEQFKALNAKMDKILKILELATGEIDENDLDDMEEDDEMPELEELRPVKAAKAAKPVVAEEAPKKKTRGQTKRAKRTGKA
jgi:CxxC-x17-CxxC domain-containing protein